MSELLYFNIMDCQEGRCTPTASFGMTSNCVIVQGNVRSLWHYCWLLKRAQPLPGGESNPYLVESPTLTWWRAQPLPGGESNPSLVESPALTVPPLPGGESHPYLVESPTLTWWRVPPFPGGEPHPQLMGNSHPEVTISHCNDNCRYNCTSL